MHEKLTALLLAFTGTHTKMINGFAAVICDLNAKLKNTKYEKIVTPSEQCHI